MSTSNSLPSESPDRRLHVLLVDDDPQILKVFSRGLAQRGFHVLSASTATEALRLSEDPGVRIDVIIMDIVLPDSWGSQVAMEQLRHRPDTKVLYISGYSQEDPVLGGSSINDAVNFLPKPFTVEDLVTKIRSVFEGGGEG